MTDDTNQQVQDNSSVEQTTTSVDSVDYEAQYNAEVSNAIKQRKRAQDAEAELSKIKDQQEKVRIKKLAEEGKLNEVVDVRKISFKHPDLSFLTIDAFPLIPAWAITIHKLQGQTIDSPLFIDYNNIPWMEKQYHLLYTAISRCKKHDDVYIISDRKITEDFFPVDPIMYAWYIEHK